MNDKNNINHYMAVKKHAIFYDASTVDAKLAKFANKLVMDMDRLEGVQFHSAQDVIDFYKQ